MTEKADLQALLDLGELRGERIFLTGGTSPLGTALGRVLAGASARVVALVRDTKKAKALLEGDVELIEGSCENLASHRDTLRSCTFVLHTAGMYLSRWIMEVCRGNKSLLRILFISSMRVLYPDSLLTRKEATARDAIREMEEEVRRSTLPWTILRPALIFSARDRSITKMVRIISEGRTLPLPGRGDAIKQPVSAEDLAKSIVKAMLAPASLHKTYNLPGRDISVREMVRVISEELGKQPKLISVPRFAVLVLKAGIELIGHDRHASYLNTFLRWYESICFSGEEAERDFAHAPRSFRENIREQLSVTLPNATQEKIQ